MGFSGYISWQKQLKNNILDTHTHTPIVLGKEMEQRLGFLPNLLEDLVNQDTEQLV